MKIFARVLTIGLLAAAGGIAFAQQRPAPTTTPPATSQNPAPTPAPGDEEAPPATVTALPPAPVLPPPPADIQPLPEKPKAVAPTEPAKPAEPLKRVRNGSAVIQAIDKVTTETLRFEVPVGKSVRYKSLVFTVRACETSAPDEDTTDSVAYMTVESQPKAQPGRPAPLARQVYKGWMYASSPGLNPLQHPVYDAWLIACKASGPAPAKR